MTAATKTILGQALHLSPTERAELVEGILHSLGRAPDAGIDAAWANEVEDRIDAYERGELTADSVENVFARVARR